MILLLGLSILSVLLCIFAIQMSFRTRKRVRQNVKDYQALYDAADDPPDPHEKGPDPGQWSAEARAARGAGDPVEQSLNARGRKRAARDLQKLLRELED